MTFINPAQKLFAHMGTLTALQNGEVPPPLSIEIDTSNRCSLGCNWCHFAFTHTRGPLAGKREKPDGAIPGGDLLDTELAKRMLFQFADAGVGCITWTGGGEPTLHPDFDELVRYTGSYGCELPQGLYTHGGHIDEQRAALLKREATFVYVSLDAANAGDYKRDKGVDRFQPACDGIRRLVAAEGSATIGVGFLVTADNWNQTATAARLVYELGADYIQFRPTVHYSQERPGALGEDTGWMRDAIAALRALKRGWDVDRPGFVEVDFGRFDGYRDWVGHGYAMCWWSALQTVVTPNGSMWTCVNKREHPASLLGSLAEESFAEIWARRPVADVDGSCRVMCRGHVANQALDHVMAQRSAPHAAFV